MHWELQNRQNGKHIGLFLFLFLNKVAACSYPIMNLMCAPFSLSTEEIKDLFGSWFDVKFLEYPDEFVEFFKSEVNVDWVRHNVHLLTLK